MQNEKIFDEKVFSILKKIDIPKNPFSFYFNLSRIENNLSEWLRDYFYRAINEFLHYGKNIEENINKSGSNFLLKIYYYTWFIDKISFSINNLLKDLKYYNLSLYLDCIYEFDKNIKLKAAIFNAYKNDYKTIKKLFNKSENDITAKEVFQDENVKSFYNKDIKNIFSEFEKKFYELDFNKNKNIINFIYKSININILKYPISYDNTRTNYKLFIKKWGKDYKYYKAINICIDKIVSKYNKNQPSCNNSLINKVISNVDSIRKNYYIKSLIEDWEKDFNKWKKLFNEKNNNNYFKYNYEFENFLTTYIINNKNINLKKLFYWEATKDRLSEDEWADIWWANLFYLQKIDENIWNFEMLMFFKQFKDTLISLNNSLFWPFIKPYFFYLLVFKSIKLQLKDWQKLFFLLMFFSAESYQEYVILQNIMKSIEKIWLWQTTIYNSKLIFYIKRVFLLLKEFFSSIILTSLIILWLWLVWLINIIMLFAIFWIIGVWWLKYFFFPWRFEILRTFAILSISILWYIWFTTVFPKITQPQYISYVWKWINSIVSLNFSWTKQNYNNMISFIYWENYKKYEKEIIAWIYNRIWKVTDDVKSNENVKQFTKNTKKIITDIIQKQDEYISMKEWTYLKYYINKQIDTFNLEPEQKKHISTKVVNKYIKWYCFKNQDEYCNNNLEKLPVGFKLNMTKIKEIINESL